LQLLGLAQKVRKQLRQMKLAGQRPLQPLQLFRQLREFFLLVVELALELLRLIELFLEIAELVAGQDKALLPGFALRVVEREIEERGGHDRDQDNVRPLQPLEKLLKAIHQESPVPSTRNSTSNSLVL